MNEKVSLSYLDSYDTPQVVQAVKQAFELLNVSTILKPKMKVLIKGCFPTDKNPDTAETSHPKIVGGLVRVLNEMDVECILADSPYKAYNSAHLEEVYVNTGMLGMANGCKCTLNYNLKSFTREVPDGVKLKSVTLLDVVNDVDAIINLSKLKMDEDLGYVGATANLLGLVPGEIKTQLLNRMYTQRDVSDLSCDLYLATRDKLVLNIMDAVVTREAENRERLLYCLAMSENVFSLDATMLNILGVDLKNTVVATAAERGLFDMEAKIKVVGEKLETFKLEDYKLTEIDPNKNIHKSASGQKRYYNSHQQRPIVNKPVCKGCGVCARICPTGAIKMKYDKNGELFACIDYTKCILCFKCHTACPYSVIDLKTPIKFKRLKSQIDKENIDKEK